MSDITRSDEAYRAWMRCHLDRAVDTMGLTVTGPVLWGWNLRSASARVTGPEGPCWLRVGVELTRDVEDATVADFWTGIPSSNAVVGVRKPRVLRSIEWAEPEHKRMVRADVMTLMPGSACSPTDALRTRLDLPSSWWAELRRTVDVVRATPTDRYSSRVRRSSTRVAEVFGRYEAEALLPVETETVHQDMHWSNVLGPEFGLLDWELWGCGPIGTDAATLFLFALLMPDTADQVYATFADILAEPAGIDAQIRVAARILWRADVSRENLDLAAVVRDYIRPMMIGR